MTTPILPPADKILAKLRELEQRLQDLERAPRVVTPPAGG